ncbi:hypothetical protein ACTPEM_25300, partial [Clostridioides difficile]
ENTTGKITLCKVEKKELKSKIKVLSVKEKNKEVGLEEAEVIVGQQTNFTCVQFILLLKVLTHKACINLSYKCIVRGY